MQWDERRNKSQNEQTSDDGSKENDYTAIDQDYVCWNVLLGGEKRAETYESQRHKE